MQSCNCYERVSDWRGGQGGGRWLGLCDCYIFSIYSKESFLTLFTPHKYLLITNILLHMTISGQTLLKNGFFFSVYFREKEKSCQVF